MYLSSLILYVDYSTMITCNLKKTTLLVAENKLKIFMKLLISESSLHLCYFYIIKSIDIFLQRKYENTIKSALEAKVATPFQSNNIFRKKIIISQTIC